MTINVNNQQPGRIGYGSVYSLAGNFDPFAEVRDKIVAPLLVPLVPGAPVTIDVDGKTVDADAITSTLFSCCDDRVNVASEDLAKGLLSKLLVSYDTSLNVQDLYAVQAGKENQMLMPSPRVTYTPTDVIDAAKQLLSGQIRPEAFFATMAFYARLPMLGYYFANDIAWDQFKAWLANELTGVQSMLSVETVNLCTSLQAIRLNHMTEGIVIRDDEGQNNENYSFARLLPFYLDLYEAHCRQSGMPQHIIGRMPFSFSDNVCPRVIMLVNVERHACALPADIKKEWDIVKSAMRMKPKVLGNNQIAKLTAVARNVAKMAGYATSKQVAGNTRSATIRFRKSPPTYVDIYAQIERIYKHTAFVQSSENAIKQPRRTFQRPSRRDPNNPDIQGKTTGTAYRPNLHIYLDCSGSVTESMYRDAIKACIRLAKKMNINIYFSSFSHILSQTTKLPVKGKSVGQIYDIFQKVPKVSGGTDYELVWHYINASDRRAREVSLLISDFDYEAPNHYVKHPRFLYYAPVSTDKSYWSHITDKAKAFAQSMLGICPAIRKQILF